MEPGLGDASLSGPQPYGQPCWRIFCPASEGQGGGFPATCTAAAAWKKGEELACFGRAPTTCCRGWRSAALPATTSASELQPRLAIAAAIRRGGCGRDGALLAMMPSAPVALSPRARARPSLVSLMGLLEAPQLNGMGRGRRARPRRPRRRGGRTRHPRAAADATAVTAASGVPVEEGGNGEGEEAASTGRRR
jgi:hypothetical protein